MFSGSGRTLNPQSRYSRFGDRLVVEPAGQSTHADGPDHRSLVENRDPAWN